MNLNTSGKVCWVDITGIIPGLGCLQPLLRCWRRSWWWWWWWWWWWPMKKTCSIDSQLVTNEHRSVQRFALRRPSTRQKILPMLPNFVGTALRQLETTKQNGPHRQTKDIIIGTHVRGFVLIRSPGGSNFLCVNWRHRCQLETSRQIENLTLSTDGHIYLKNISAKFHPEFPIPFKTTLDLQVGLHIYSQPHLLGWGKGFFQGGITNQGAAVFIKQVGYVKVI